MSKAGSQQLLEEIASQIEYSAFDFESDHDDDDNRPSQFINNKSTFVLRKRDLEYLNREYQKKTHETDYNHSYTNDKSQENILSGLSGFNNEMSTILPNGTDGYQPNGYEDTDSEYDPDYTEHIKDTNYISTDEDEFSEGETADDLNELTREIEELESDNEREFNRTYQYEPFFDEFNMTDQPGSEYEPPATLKSQTILYCIRSMPILIAFVAILFIAKISSKNFSYADSPIDAGLINHKFHTYEKRLSELSTHQSNLQFSQNMLASHISSLNNELKTKLDAIDVQFNGFLNSFEKNVLEVSNIRYDYNKVNDQIVLVHSELENLKSLEFKGIEGETDVASSLKLAKKIQTVENNISELTTQVQELHQFKQSLEERFANLDSKIYDTIANNLPSFIPISYSSERGIQTIPEFDTYIKSLIGNEVSNDSNSHQSWDEFLEDNQIDLGNYLIDISTKNNIRFVSHDELADSIAGIKTSLKAELSKMKQDLERGLVYSKNGNGIDPAVLNRVVKSTISKELNSRHEFENSNVVNYANYDNGARVIEQLTTLPKLKRVRTKVLDRILHGLSDFIKRHTVGPKRRLIGLNDINLTTKENSPSNALLNNNQYWQCLTEDLPVSFAVKLSQPIYVKQVGLTYPNINYLSKAGPKKVSLLVQPTIGKQTKLLKNKLSGYYNQDFLLKSLKNYAKVSDFEFNVKSPETFQTFPIIDEIQLLLNEFSIRSILILLETNWGDELVTVIHGVKVFGLTEFEMKNSRIMLHQRFDGGKISSKKKLTADESMIGDLGRDIPF